ncbi:hypothetical protein FOA52_000548 [Chlamydomonas sp. UWO 241]|nr:hypothetical protein FOA52_000548 [Chlamydomonas sp. UWO 241]
MVRSALRGLGAVALVGVASLMGSCRPAHAAAPSSLHGAPTAMLNRGGGSTGASYTGLDLAEASGTATAVLDDRREASAAGIMSTSAPLGAAPVPKGYVAIGYDELMRSMVYDPSDVPVRHTRREIAEQLEALYLQYDNEDFDLGIKQFMIEQAIQADLEDGMDKKGGAGDFEEKLAEALFADTDAEEKDTLKTADVWPDAFTTEVAEEFITAFGEPGSLSTAWRVRESLSTLSYTQFWALVGEGRVTSARFYGPEQRSMLVVLSASAPGGARTVKITAPPDPMLLDHLRDHGVGVALSPLNSSTRWQQGFVVQLLRITFPFMFISFIFWIIHTWVLDPMPNVLKRSEFLRYRRELLYVTSKLNFRSPAREVRVDASQPDFISWEDINGIDEVKREITEIIDYLKNPALLRQRGVARIGGVLLAGSPGTGKTLLAKSIAGEACVRMFTCSGTDFFDMYAGVGVRRIKETFDKMREAAPALLFIDEFDALGASRGAQAGGDEATSIINELLVQLDGFENNSGVVVLGATNRPGAIDAALMKPGRFDRVTYMPMPDAVGRAEILQVHARTKSVSPDINWYEVARSMAGYTGADCMGLMQRAARMAARQGRDVIVEEDIYTAMEVTSVEAHSDNAGQLKAVTQGEGAPDPIPHALRRAIAVYEAGKALLAYISPEFDEIARVAVCPFDVITGYCLFAQDESTRGRSADDEPTRPDLEAHVVVNLAGRCAEKLVLGESEVTSLGSTDVYHANMIAREMILSFGLGRKTGPAALMHVTSTAVDDGSFLKTPDSANPSEEYFHHAAEMSTEQARVALAEVLELLEAAEAKAYYGLAINWVPLQALVDALMERGVMQGNEVSAVLEGTGVIHFPDAFTDGFGWEADGSLLYPHKPAKEASVVEAQDARAMRRPAGPSNEWHWNTPYTFKRDLPDWYKKEVQRYVH